MQAILYFMILIVCIVSIFGITNHVQPGCSPDSEVCEFVLIIQHRYTMMSYTSKGLGVMQPVSVDGDGRFWARQKYCEGNVLLPEEEVDNVIIGDGSHKLMMVFNSSLPGPPIVVYEGQQVAVKLINNLESQATTIHFHGIHQRGTPWMDGADSVSQCGVNPRESFTYRFIAHPPGTHWYHSHLGAQRTMGAYGPLIVLPKIVPTSLPEIEDEFMLVLQDFMRKDSMDIFIITTTEAVSWPYGFDSEFCFNSTKQADGFDCGVTPFDSGVINGKGRHYSQMNGKIENPHIPLEVFKVKRGKRYKLRIISGSMTFAFRVSIDNHPMHVIASDGNDLEPREVESLIIFSGERYDVWFEANDPQNMGNYWIRAETLERWQSGSPIEPGHTEAILRYDGNPHVKPVTSRKKCNAHSPCPILNCPYRSLPDDEHSPCLPLSEMRAKDPIVTLGIEEDEDIVEFFLNFHFAGMDTEGIWRTTINGKINILPTTPYQLHGGNISDIITPCDLKMCSESICHCSHVLDIPYGKTVQLNLVITVNNPEGVYNGNNHPIHIHGYRLQVLKTGWPEYHPVTKMYTRANQDLLCNNEMCNNIGWKNQSWHGGNVPGINLKEAPQKDTVVVPIGGYVVTRFKSDNPGFWFMHCHTEFHNLEGMSLVLKVGDKSQMKPPPPNLRSCGSFAWSNQEFLATFEANNTKSAEGNNQLKSASITSIPTGSSINFIAVTIACGIVGLVIVVTLIVALKRRFSLKQWKYTPLDPSP